MKSQFACALLFSATKLVFAEGIVTDGTMGAVQTFNGDKISIPQTLGKTEGNNLFHSFADFNIDKGQTVIFTGTDNLQNVISRVTSENKSIIDGTLKSEIKNADFYFINPNGITFNANASVDVPAAFHVTTADKMDFGKNGGVFYADLSKKSQLSSDSPVALGFLGTSKVNNGLIDFDNSKLTFKEGKTLDIVAGKISIVGNGTQYDVKRNLINQNIKIPSGEVRLVSIQKEDSVALEKTGSVLPLPKSLLENSSDITISGAVVDVSGDGAGRIAFFGKNVTVNAGDSGSRQKSYLLSGNNGNINANEDNGIYIHSESFNLLDSDISNSNIKVKIFDENGYLKGVEMVKGKGSNIDITADSIKLEYSHIFNNTNNMGDAGSIFLTTHTLNLLNSTISSNSENGGYVYDANGSFEKLILDAGRGGDVTILATNSVELADSSLISTSTHSNGDAGSVVLTTDSLNLSNLSKIFSRSDTDGNYIYDSDFNISSVAIGNGQGGSVHILANSIKLDNGFISTSTSTDGEAGSTELNTDSLNLINKAQISSSVLANTIYDSNFNMQREMLGKGNGGSVNIIANSIKLDNGFITSDTYSKGDAGIVNIESKTLDIQNKGKISSSTQSDGKGGEVHIVGDNLTIIGNKSDSQNNFYWDTGIAATADLKSTGMVGNIDIEVKESLEVNNKGKITIENSGNKNSIGTKVDNIKSNEEGKNIKVSANSIRLDDGSITSDTYGENEAGKVDVKSKTLDILNNGYISSSTKSKGKAGNISVNSDILNIKKGSLASETSGNGQAGNIVITANKLKIDGEGGVTTSSVGKGDAGIIEVQTKTLEIYNSGKVSSSTNFEGNAGIVNVIADNIKIDGKGQNYTNSIFNTGIASAAMEKSSGNAGLVNVKAKILEIFDGGEITSSTISSGEAGTIKVIADYLEIDGKNIGATISSDSNGKTSSGKIGNVTVTANYGLHLMNNGVISMTNDAVILPENLSLYVPSEIIINAPIIDMADSEITTQSNGNMKAGNINIHFLNRLNMDYSFINTTANTGDGGTINVSGGELIRLKNSGFKTTVVGEDSNGGDISVKVPILVMDTGLIQANAMSGNGGNINLVLQALIPSENQLLKGGKSVEWNTSPLTSNVIQAASQTGVSGTVSNSAPQLNLSGVLSNIGNNNFDTRPINQDYCKIEKGSSLSKKGKGGLPLRAKDLQVY